MELMKSTGPGPPSLKDWSKRVRLSLSDPNFVSGAMLLSSVNEEVLPYGNGSTRSIGPSLLELKGLARRFGLKFMALRGGAVYLSTEAFYLELKDNGEEILHILNPESIEVLPPGGDLVVHLQGLMELRPQDWKELSRLQNELKNLIGNDLIPRLGGTPAQIRFYENAPTLSILPKDDCFVLQFKEPFSIAEEKISELEKACGFSLSSGLSGKGEFLMDLISPESPLITNLPDQKHHYYLTQHMKGTQLTSIPFSSSSQVPGILIILKTQALYNSLISSCGSPNHQSNNQKPNLAFEVSSLNLNQLVISFEHPIDEEISSLEIIIYPKLKTKLYSVSAFKPEYDELLDRILDKVSSIPLLMRTVVKYHKCYSGIPLKLSGSLFGRGERKEREISSIQFDNSSFTVDSLNAEGPQEVMCAPGADHHHPTIKKTNLNTYSKPNKVLSNRKSLFDESNLRPVVSITPVSDSSSPGLQSLDKKIGIEIIPLGGVRTSLVHKPHREMKRSLSEDDKRKSNRKDKKRKHVSLDKVKKIVKVSSELKKGDSLKLTLKGSSKGSSKSAPGSPKIPSSRASSLVKYKKRDKERLLQEEEVKRLLTGGKLFNKTFQIPKISKDSDFEKKIPSLMSLTPPPLYTPGIKEGNKFSITSPRGGGRSSISPVLSAKRTSPSSASKSVSSASGDVLDNL